MGLNKVNTIFLLFFIIYNKYKYSFSCQFYTVKVLYKWSSLLLLYSTIFLVCVPVLFQPQDIYHLGKILRNLQNQSENAKKCKTVFSKDKFHAKMQTLVMYKKGDPLKENGNYSKRMGFFLTTFSEGKIWLLK